MYINECSRKYCQYGLLEVFYYVKFDIVMYTPPTNQDPVCARQEMKPASHTLLYVEDNPANLLLVKQLISRREDMKLLTAISGDLGILLAQVYQPDVILMDINLPGMSGFDALKILRNELVTRHIPVIALSSNAFRNEITEGLNAGFIRYLTKPYLVSELFDAIDVALRHAEVIEESN